MIECVPAAVETGQIILLLRPNRALSRNGLRRLVGALALAALAVALLATWQGNAFALPFAALEIPVVALALGAAWRAGDRAERITLDAHALRVQSVPAGGGEMSFPSGWVRVGLRQRGGHPRVLLTASGRQREVGAFLGTRSARSFRGNCVRCWPDWRGARDRASHQGNAMKPGGIENKAMKALAALGACGAAGTAWANAATDPRPWQLNLDPGVTEQSHQIYALHMAALWVCVVIGIVVFGAMIYAMARFRKSKGAVPAKWSHNTKLELVWTVIPVLILAGLAWPASDILIDSYNTTHADMTVKVTGYQWKWRYDYVDYMGKPVDKVGFMSRLDPRSDKIRELGSGLDPYSVTDHGFKDYLLDVDHPLVLPAGIKIRFVITGGDVIHGFWVPPFGVKKDAVPGIVNDAWTEVDQPGLYRGQCHVLCGQDHGFMPIVVKVVPKAEFESWLAAQESAAKLDAAARTAQAVAPATNVVAQH